MRQFPNEPLIRFFDIGYTEAIMLNDVKTTREALQSQCYKLVKPNFVRRVLGEINGTGVFFEEGESHKRQRRLLTGPFSYGSIKEMLPFFDEKAQELVGVLRTSIRRKGDELVELSSLFSSVTLDIITLACLGLRMHNMTEPSPFALAYAKVFENTPWSAIMHTLNVYIPIRKLVPVKANREFLQANQTVRDLLRQQIRNKRASLEGKEKAAITDKDLLALMIKERGQGAEIWTEDEMLGHVTKLILLSGHETTAGTLTLTAHTLANHRDIQDRLRKEMTHYFPSGASLDVATIDKMPYLKNFSQEILRFYAPGIVNWREVAEDIVLAGTRIPKGTIIHIAPAALHHNASIWGPTVDEFDPDRWDNISGDAKDPFAFGSFHNGPRICIGKSFALLEYKVILIRLLQNFVFEDPEQKPLEFERGAVSLRPTGGMHLRVQPIDNKGQE
ncbi:uncharacterized protein A1O5_11677 [Cladophialophora psammophila CBS 110553]|uniref:Cytochrome P450 n=1 Tax=Cladophialophora psammophila CBS 110553 TaxID=1182543 RepID=W9WFM7_9EURO|nr:uncharacterized protein A1O5_11677 [Cladophialophora psammophila CBS 110553]EXJ63356.1 hypothetical protein A1O5_11677 [Cladophialophora psammophila CBS 110553]